MESVQDLSKADQLDFKKARTFKGKKIIEALKPKAVEDPKKTVFIKGNKTSEFTLKTLQSLYLMKKSNSLALSDRWELRPFETAEKLEHLCNKRDCGLFVFGSHTKKRPNTLLMGRMYNEKLLDLVEFEIKNMKELDPKCEIVPEEKPCLIFQGDVFEYKSEFMRIKNLLGDFFNENDPVEKINLREGVRHFIVVTGDEATNTVYIRQYELVVSFMDIVDGKTDFKEMAKEIGPSLDLVYKRANFANDEDFKKACKQPKVKKDKSQKNISTNELGEKRGRVFVEKQNLGELALKKRKKLKRDVPTEEAKPEFEGEGAEDANAEDDVVADQ
jgi:ribosome production factor 2